MCSIGTGTPHVDFVSAVASAVALADTLTAMTADGVWSQVAVSSVADLTASLLRARDALGAVVTEGVGQVHSSGALPGGHVSTTRWLETEGLSPGSASAQLARVQALVDLPRTRLAWLAGELSEDKVGAITSGGRQLCRGRSVPEAAVIRAQLEAALVPYAAGATVAELRRRITRFRVRFDPDGVDAATLAAYDDQALRVTPVGDGYDVRGYLAKETAAALLTVLDATVEGWYRTGDLSDPDRDLAAGDPDDPRVLRRRRMRRPHLHALALAEVCDSILGAGELPTRHGVRPHLRVSVDAEEYRAGLGGELHVPGHDPEPITSTAVDRILCDADITQILTRPAHSCDEHSRPGAAGGDWLRDARREVLYVGRTARTAPPRLRAALEVRDRHCAFPHCSIAASRCHAHHVQHWHDGGSTDLANLVLVCHGHHHQIHEGGWALTRHPDKRPGEPGCWTFTPPERQP